MILYYLAFILCVCLSAFFSASEMCLSASNRLRLEGLAENGNRKAVSAIKLLDRYENALSAILIGNNLVNIAASSLASVIALLIAQSTGVAEGLCTTLATILTTLLVIIFGETMPKITARKNANRAVMLFSVPLKALEWLLRPLVKATVALVSLFTKGVQPVENSDDAVEELQSIIETAEDEEVLDEDRSELLRSALDFADISAAEVMTARVDMIYLDLEDDPEKIRRVIDESPYSRLPVCEGDSDNIVGVLHLNAWYRALLDQENPDIRPLLTPPLFVYKTVKLPALLEQLRAKKTHLAVVTDEYGGTDGVVSMEDVLETLVGDIWDETDEIEPDITEEADGSWTLDGDMSLGDLPELLELDESLFDFESETVGGWVMEMLNGFAKPGDTFVFQDYRFTVQETDGLRVEHISVKKENRPAE